MLLSAVLIPTVRLLLLKSSACCKLKYVKALPMKELVLNLSLFMELILVS